MDFPVFYVCIIFYIAAAFKEDHRMVALLLGAVPGAGRGAVVGPGHVGARGYCPVFEGPCPYLVSVSLGFSGFFADFGGCEEGKRIVRWVLQSCVGGDFLNHFGYATDSAYGFIRVRGAKWVKEALFDDACIRGQQGSDFVLSSFLVQNKVDGGETGFVEEFRDVGPWRRPVTMWASLL